MAEVPELPVPKPEVVDDELLDCVLLLPCVRALKAVVVCEEDAEPVLTKRPAMVCCTAAGSALPRGKAVTCVMP